MEGDSWWIFNSTETGLNIQPISTEFVSNKRILITSILYYMLLPMIYKCSWWHWPRWSIIHQLSNEEKCDNDLHTLTEFFFLVTLCMKSECTTPEYHLCHHDLYYRMLTSLHGNSLRIRSVCFKNCMFLSLCKPIPVFLV